MQCLYYETLSLRLLNASNPDASCRAPPMAYSLGATVPSIKICERKVDKKYIHVKSNAKY